MQTLIALYETEDIARRVEADLIGAGIAQANVRVEGGVYEDESRHVGGVGGFFRWLFGADNRESDVYAESVRRGDWAVIVQAEDANTHQIEDILYSYNPIDVDARGEYFRNAGWTGYEEGASTYTRDEMMQDRTSYNEMYASTYGTDMPTGYSLSTTTTTTTDHDQHTGYSAMNVGDQERLEVVEEELEVGKREVERGRVRVRTYVTERPVNTDVTLRDERVTVERRSVDRPATDADFMNQEDVIEIVETEERPVVSKTARVVEEVIVGKESREHTETIQDTVRRKDVEVDASDAGSTYDADTQPNRNSME